MMLAGHQHQQLTRGASAASLSRIDQRALATSSTEAMVKSFIFSKPSEASTAFESWGSATQHHPLSGDRGSGERRSPQRAPQHNHGVVPPLPRQAHSAGAQPQRQQHNGYEPHASYTDAQAHRRAATTAWKRRSFVEQVNAIPHHLQHKSVVPAVPISPRAVPPQGSGSAEQPQLRPSTGGSCGSAASGRPASGVLPVGDARRSMPDGHPMHASSAQLGWVHLEDVHAHQRTRRALAARVAHVTDYAVQRKPSSSSSSIHRGTSASNRRSPPRGAPVAPPRLSRDRTVVVAASDGAAVGARVPADVDASTRSGAPPPRALDMTVGPREDVETTKTTAVSTDATTAAADQNATSSPGDASTANVDGRHSEEAAAVEQPEVPSRNSSATPSGGVVLRRRRRSSPSLDATPATPQHGASGADSSDIPSLGASQRSASDLLTHSQGGGGQLPLAQPRDGGGGAPSSHEEAKQDAELLDEGIAAASLHDDDILLNDSDHQGVVQRPD